MRKNIEGHHTGHENNYPCSGWSGVGKKQCPICRVINYFCDVTSYRAGLILTFVESLSANEEQSKARKDIVRNLYYSKDSTDIGGVVDMTAEIAGIKPIKRD